MTQTIEAALRAPLPDTRAVAERFAARAAAAGAADIAYATIESPVGPLLIATTHRGLVRLAYLPASADALLEDLGRRVSPRIVEAPSQLEPVARELDEYFSGRREAFGARIDWALVGNFARRVLKATVAVPYGNVASYADVARKAGSPGGSRAAGNALGRNPIAIIVPCHRIVRTGGGLGGYTGGLDRKRLLLAIEGTQERPTKAATPRRSARQK